MPLRLRCTRCCDGYVDFARDITLHTAHTLYSNEAHLLELLPAVDLLVGAVLVPGAKAQIKSGL